jgi:hypothetical protein
LVKGTAVYTSNFTPSTTPLTAITNTSLLTCQSNRFIDNSTNNFTITKNGDVRVTNFAPFAPTAEYSTGTNGGSGYFDGATDYLSAANNTAFVLDGTFTLEAWVYPSRDYSTFQTIFTKRAGDTPAAWQLYISKTTGYLAYYNGSGYVSTTVVPLNTWSHVAAVYDGTNINLYLNGVRVLQSATTNTDQSTGVKVGYHFSSEAEAFQGFITDARIVKGSQVYSGTTYTVPTAPLTAISGTSLLLKATNGAIFDNSMKNDLETVGNAQISTSVKKFGTGSMYFDGSGDGLLGTNSIVGYTAGNFTWECWVNFTSTSGNPCLIATTSGAERDLLYFNSSTGITYVINRGGSDQVTISQGATTGWSTGTWYHVAVVRNSNTYTIYRDGTSVATGTSAYAKSNLNAPITLGYSNYSASYLYLNGYIDDARITNGVARYTANFTAPTAPFPNK